MKTILTLLLAFLFSANAEAQVKHILPRAGGGTGPWNSADTLKFLRSKGTLAPVWATAPIPDSVRASYHSVIADTVLHVSTDITSYSTTIGDGVSDSIVVTHNLHTIDIILQGKSWPDLNFIEFAYQILDSDRVAIKFDSTAIPKDTSVRITIHAQGATAVQGPIGPQGPPGSSPTVVTSFPGSPTANEQVILTVDSGGWPSGTYQYYSAAWHNLAHPFMKPIHVHVYLGGVNQNISTNHDYMYLFAPTYFTISVNLDTLVPNDRNNFTGRPQPSYSGFGIQMDRNDLYPQYWNIGTYDMTFAPTAPFAFDGNGDFWAGELYDSVYIPDGKGIGVFDLKPPNSGTFDTVAIDFNTFTDLHYVGIYATSQAGPLWTTTNFPRSPTLSTVLLGGSHISLTTCDSVCTQIVTNGTMGGYLDLTGLGIPSGHLATQIALLVTRGWLVDKDS